MPLEKVLAFTDPDFTDVALSKADRSMIDRLALPLNEVLAAAKANRHISCKLKDRQMTLDFQGRVQLCCAVFDFGKYTLSHYLSTSHDTLQCTKDAHTMCTRCMAQGVHAYATYNVPNLDRMAKLRVYRHYANAGHSLESPALSSLIKHVGVKFIHGLRKTFGRESATLVEPEA